MSWQNTEMRAKGDEAFRNFIVWLAEERPDVTLLPWQIYMAGLYFGMRAMLQTPAGGGKTFVVNLIQEYMQEQGMKEIKLHELAGYSSIFDDIEFDFTDES